MINFFVEKERKKPSCGVAASRRKDLAFSKTSRVDGGVNTVHCENFMVYYYYFKKATHLQ